MLQNLLAIPLLDCSHIFTFLLCRRFHKLLELFHQISYCPNYLATNFQVETQMSSTQMRKNEIFTFTQDEFVLLYGISMPFKDNLITHATLNEFVFSLVMSSLHYGIDLFTLVQDIII